MTTSTHARPGRHAVSTGRATNWPMVLLSSVVMVPLVLVSGAEPGADPALDAMMLGLAVVVVLVNLVTATTVRTAVGPNGVGVRSGVLGLAAGHLPGWRRARRRGGRPAVVGRRLRVLVDPSPHPGPGTLDLSGGAGGGGIGQRVRELSGDVTANATTNQSSPTEALRVEIWSDVVCPWCYIGKRRFERALAEFPHAEAVEIRWRSFQLDPQAAAYDPAEPSRDLAEHLGAKYGGGRAAGLQMLQHVSGIAEGEGLTYDLEHARGGNTVDAHRMLHAAVAQGGTALQGALKERLLRGYFCERENISDVLTRAWAERGATGSPV